MAPDVDEEFRVADEGCQRLGGHAEVFAAPVEDDAPAVGVAEVLGCPAEAIDEVLDTMRVVAGVGRREAVEPVRFESEAREPKHVLQTHPDRAPEVGPGARLVGPEDDRGHRAPAGAPGCDMAVSTSAASTAAASKCCRASSRALRAWWRYAPSIAATASTACSGDPNSTMPSPSGTVAPSPVDWRSTGRPAARYWHDLSPIHPARPSTYAPLTMPISPAEQA